MIYLFTSHSVLIDTHYFYENEIVYNYTEYSKSTFINAYHISDFKNTIPVPSGKSFIMPPKNEWIHKYNYGTEKIQNTIKLRIEEIIFEKLSENH
jgi:hypothetical protein